MKAVIIATCETSQASPLSCQMPAALLPVANRPVMLYNIDLLARQGCKDIIACLRHHAGAIESYFGDGLRWGITIQYSLQRDALGTAGVLGRARALIDETFLVVPANILMDLDITALLIQHHQQGNTATRVIFPGRPAVAARPDTTMLSTTQPGAQDFDPGQPTGVYLFEPKVLDFIPARASFDIETQLIPALSAAGLPVGTFSAPGYFNPLHTITDFHAAQTILLGSDDTVKPVLTHAPLRYLRLNRPPLRPGIWVGRNSTVHPSAQVTPPVLVGDNCRVGRDVELGPEAVLGNDVIVDDGATVRASTILDHTYLGRLVKVENRIVWQNQLIDASTGETARIVDPFLISATHLSIEQSPLRQIFESLLALLVMILGLPMFLPLALVIWQASGRVFEPVTRIRPFCWRPKDSENQTWPAQGLETYALLRFASGRRKGRETPLSRWIEHWGLERLPELWNVITGELRLVGVRPIALEEIVHYCEDWQQKICEYQPGFTGLWFIQAGPDSALEEIQLADAYYVATRSWKGDMAIMRKTLAAWVRRCRQASKMVQASSIGI